MNIDLSILKLFSRLLSVALLFVLTLTANSPASAQSLFGGSDSNPLGSLLEQLTKGSEKGKSVKGGAKGKPVRSNPSAGGLGSLFGNILSAKNNTTLGPVGLHLLGRELSARLLGANKVAPFDDPRVAYLRLIVYNLLGESYYNRGYKDAVVFIIEDDKTVNAHAAPGGFVFVTSGLLKFAKNEDELAFVLAHEVAHVELNHGLNAIKQATGQSTANEAFNFGESLQNTLSDGYSRDIEGEADIRAGELLVKTGYDVKTGVKIIDRLEKISKRKHATGYPKDRLKKVMLGVSVSGLSTPSNPDARYNRFKKALNR